MSPAVETETAHWIHRPPEPGQPLMLRLRHRQPLQTCRLESMDGGRLRVRFETPQRAATPGQSAVFYDGDVCLGGAVIASRRTLASESEASVPV